MDQLLAWLTDEEIARGLETATYIAGIVGIPVAIALYARSLAGEARNREWEIYQAVQEKYLQFVELAIGQPKVGVLLTEPDEPRETLSSDQQVIRDALFDVLCTVLERAFLVYKRASSGQRKQQWAGCESFIDAYAHRRNFRDWWIAYTQNSQISAQYDLAFEHYLNERIALFGGGHSPSTGSARAVP